ncbi:MAG: acyltransferase family protein [Fimbriimonadaceae bacterium]|nr:acyltransferase family protein [Fimbriimonadaceae bacterium]
MSENCSPPAPAAGSRLAYAEPLRLWACGAVILIHVCSGPVAEFGRLAPRDWWIAAGLRAAVTWAVPVFVMLSGALLLDPRKDEPLRQFVVRRCSRVGWPLLAASTAYLAWRVYYRQETPTPLWALRHLAYGTTWAHLYFLYLIAGLYAVTPVLRQFTRHASRRQQWALALVALAVGILDKLLRTTFHSGGASGLLLFGPYLGYYALGWLLRDVVLCRRRCVALGTLWLAATAFTTLLCRAAMDLADGPGWRFYAFEFLTPQIALQAVCTWLLAQQLWRQARSRRLTRLLGEATLGVYLLHPAVLDWLRHQGLTSTWHGAATGIAVSALVAAAVSLLVTLLLLALPGLRRLVGG